MDLARQRELLLKETAKKLQEAVTEDQLAIQAITMIEQLEVASNSLSRKVREWYALWNPELVHKIKSNEGFLEQALQAQKGLMGGNLTKTDQAALHATIATVKHVSDEKERLAIYLEELLKKLCPNMQYLAGTSLAAKLLHHAGSLQHLATVPSGTLQLYGAEVALFRHLQNRKHKSPKYGIIFNHPMVQKTPQAGRGKAARTLADKLSICAKIDLFKGDFAADAIKKKLEGKFGAW